MRISDLIDPLMDSLDQQIDGLQHPKKQLPANKAGERALAASQRVQQARRNAAQAQQRTQRVAKP
jgi:hypothetical protein